MFDAKKKQQQAQYKQDVNTRFDQHFGLIWESQLKVADLETVSADHDRRLKRLENLFQQFLLLSGYELHPVPEKPAIPAVPAVPAVPAHEIVRRIKK